LSVNMASLSCPLCHRETEMRDYCTPPYRFGLAGIATAISADHSGWSEAEGFCETCAGIYRARLRERKRIAEEILNAINKLPELEKRIFVFYHYRGMTVPDLAGREHIEEQCIREMLAHAAKVLYGQLHAHLPLARKLGIRATR
jgi:hypothetical protein